MGLGAVNRNSQTLPWQRIVVASSLGLSVWFGNVISKVMAGQINIAEPERDDYSPTMATLLYPLKPIYNIFPHEPQKSHLGILVNDEKQMTNAIATRIPPVLFAMIGSLLAHRFLFQGKVNAISNALAEGENSIYYNSALRETSFGIGVYSVLTAMLTMITPNLGGPIAFAVFQVANFSSLNGRSFDDGADFINLLPKFAGDNLKTLLNEIGWTVGDKGMSMPSLIPRVAAEMELLASTIIKMAGENGITMSFAENQLEAFSEAAKAVGAEIGAELNIVIGKGGNLSGDGLNALNQIREQLVTQGEQSLIAKFDEMFNSEFTKAINEELQNGLSDPQHNNIFKEARTAIEGWLNVISNKMIGRENNFAPDELDKIFKTVFNTLGATALNDHNITDINIKDTLVKAAKSGALDDFFHDKSIESGRRIITARRADIYVADHLVNMASQMVGTVMDNLQDIMGVADQDKWTSRIKEALPERVEHAQRNMGKGTISGLEAMIYAMAGVDRVAANLLERNLYPKGVPVSR